MIKQRTLPYLASSEPYFERIRHLGYAVFLDSGRPKCPWGRFDIISAQPVELLELDSQGHKQPFSALQALYNKYQISLSENPDLPFQGGVIGHFSYDLGRSTEQFENLAARYSKLPDLRAGLYLWAVVVDHRKETATLIATSHIQDNQLDALETLPSK